MASYAGLDVSLEETEVCIVDAAGAVVKETKVASEPEALLGFFERLDLEMERIGLEACSLTAWSFSIWLEDGWLFDGGAIGEPKENQPVFDSGAQFEQKIAEAFPAYFNVDDTDIKFDNKSRKGLCRCFRSDQHLVGGGLKTGSMVRSSPHLGSAGARGISLEP